MRNNPPTFPGPKFARMKQSIELVDDGDAHGTASASNLALSGFQSGAVHVGHLGLGDLGDLSLGDGANLLLVGDTGALLQADGLLNQQRGRGGLGDEGKAAVRFPRPSFSGLTVGRFRPTSRCSETI